MKILLASADLDDITWASDHGLIDGVVTSPALLADVGDGDDRQHLAEICRATSLPVHAAVTSVGAADIYRDGRELAKLSDHLTVQVPLVEEAVIAMRRLSAEGVRVAATLVFNAAQALLAAKAGASAVSTSLDHLEALGDDAAAALHDIRRVFDAAQAECDLLAALPRNAMQFTGCALAGVDGVTVTLPVLRMLLVHPLTDRGVDQFLSDLSRRPKARPTA